MEHSYFAAIVVDWLINVAFGVVALVCALCAIALYDKVVLKSIDFIDEIRKGNMAAAVGFAAMLAFAAYIIGAAVK